jgi:hypothetical protein
MFLEHTFFISAENPSRYPLYLLWRTPPQEDASSIGAEILHLRYRSHCFSSYFYKGSRNHYQSDELELLVSVVLALCLFF